MRCEPAAHDCRLVIDSKCSLEDVLHLIADLSHADHMCRQLLSVYNQLEDMRYLKGSVGASVSFLSADWSSSAKS